MKHSDFYCKRIFEKVKRAKGYAGFMLRKCENSQKFSIGVVKCIFFGYNPIEKLCENSQKFLIETGVKYDNSKRHIFE